MAEVLIIGVDPPCPRCDLVHKWADELSEEWNEQVSVKFLPYTQPEAQAFGLKLGVRVGTAKDVSRASGLEMDFALWNRVLANRLIELEDEPARPADLWVPELDAILEPFRSAALSAGWLMTPVIAVDGDLKYQGAVPKREQLKQWIEDAL